MRKFKRGDLVEITKSYRGNEGYRFIVSDYGRDLVLRETGRKPAYRTDIVSTCNYTGYLWSAESDLKLVKPDESSDMSFEELMLDLKQPQEEEL